MKNSIINNLDIIAFAKNSEVSDIDIFNIDKYGVIKVYENEGQPALFLKEVDSFDIQTLRLIAKIQHDCWNFQKVLFLYVYSKTEIRIYNCSEKPFSYPKENKNLDFEKELQKLELFSCKETEKSKLETLNTLFSRIAIDTGFIWSATEAKGIKDKLNLQNRVDKYLIKSLINVSRKLEKEGLEDKDIIHKLVMRSLFLLYLEDKGATTKQFYTTFSANASSYFNVLENVEATYKLFERLSEDFNGSLFTITEDERKLVNSNHLDFIKKCFINGYENDEQTVLFEDWRLFDFSIIRIELLSEIYENFLSELDGKNKKDSGTFYTPPSLVELILDEKLSIQKDKTNYNVKTLDPSCGSGIFLVQSFKRLIKRYENNHNKKLTDFTILVKILQENIFGIEIEPKSIKVAAFSLYLALLDNLDPKTSWWNGNVVFPYLINDPDDSTLKEQGYNLFKRDTISDFEIKKLKNFDLVVGNPPFGTKNLSPTVKSYCDKYDFAKEMVLPFMHKATFLAPKGEIALIFNTKVLTNTGRTYQNFREWLFNKNYVEKIYNFSILRKAKKNFGGQLFGSAVGPISIVFYKSEIPKEQKETITYYAPKTFIKNNILEGIVIDVSDEKHLPRTECQKPDTKIWKIAMWGSYFDFELIEKLKGSKENISSFFKNNSIDYGVGLELSYPTDKLNNEIKKIPHINPKTILKYYTPLENAIELDNVYFRRLGKISAFNTNHVLFNEGIQNNNITASYIDYKSSFYKGLVGIYSRKNDYNLLKLITLYLNSNFTKYYAFLLTSTWGIERDVIKHKELFDMPLIIDLLDSKNKEELIIKFDEISTKFLKDDILKIVKEINEIILSFLNQDEQIIIQDTLKYSLDLFEKQEKSDAVKHVIEIEPYYNRLTNDLNNWLEDVDLKASVTHYKIDRNCPLYMVKISFGSDYKKPILSKDDIYKELKVLDRKLWKEEAQNLYFRKKLNYYDDNDVYIIKTNQRRFWSQTAAMEDCKSLLIEIANG